MTATLVAGGLAALCVLMVLRPFTTTRHPALALPDADPEIDRGGELLRQLRDLDEDLAAGKLDEDDHRRMRGPVERQAAEVLRHAENRRAEDRRAEDKPADSPPRVEAPRGRRRAAAWIALSASAVAVACVVVLLSGALTPRGTGQTITGGAGAVSSAQTPGPTPGLETNAQPTPAQLAAVDAAAARVRTSPKDVGAHLDLAQAYAGAGAPQLSAIEYLAVTQLDPGNASANTQLALIAFAAGQAAQAKKLVDTALTAHPRYPEALYARGLIQLMGLRHPTAAERDLRAYLAAAPRGSHRTSVETLLAIMSGPAR
jgi:tetratricopeptide (TPR) repeat protein